MPQTPKLSRSATVLLINTAIGVFLICCIFVLTQHLSNVSKIELLKMKAENLELKEKKSQTPVLLPPLPVEKWAYKEILKNMEVVVVLDVLPERSISNYSLWCGSFRDKYRAENMVSTIKNILPAYTEVRGEWHVVNTAVVKGKRVGEKIRHALSRRYGITTCNFKRVKSGSDDIGVVLGEGDLDL